MEEVRPADLKAHFQVYENEIVRIVEGQHFIATRKLVDSDEEQRILEEILDRSKPPAPNGNSRGALHYLLYTPFRYPPLKAGGRFHTRGEQSIFYGSETLKTAMAEVAYGRFAFLLHTTAQFKPMEIPYTHFLTKVKSSKALLLTQEPFIRNRGKISHPASYAHSQALGTAMRRSGAEMFRYYSARTPHGINVGLLSPETFRQNKPVQGKEKHWSLYVSADTVEFQRAHLADNQKESHVFRIEDFYSNGEFPAI